MRTALITVLILLSVTRLISQNTDDVEARLTPEELSDFRDHAQRVIRQLGDYVKVIGDKSSEKARRLKNVSMAVGLFVSDTNIVQVSTLGKKDPDFVFVRDYFRRLYNLNYVQVDITWYDVYLSPEFKLGTDGLYHGVATVYQKFEGTTSKEFGGGNILILQVRISR